jgi:hypothetical protein
MFTDFYHTFYYTILIIAAIATALYFNSVDSPFRLVCLLVLLTVLSEFIARYCKVNYRTNNIVYLIFTPIEFSMYAMIYKRFLNDNKWTKILYITIACLIFATVINSIFFQPPLKTPTNIMDIESVLLVILSLKLFIDIREKPVYEKVTTEGVFWFNSAVLFYYSFAILFWGIHNMVYRLTNPPVIIYDALLLFSGLLYVVYVVSVFLNYRAVKLSKANE